MNVGVKTELGIPGIQAQGENGLTAIRRTFSDILLGLQTYAVSSTAFIHPKFSFLESFVGINREHAWISIFPLLINVPLVGMIFYTVRAWKQELWHISWRIYHTLITLATIFYSTVMSGETISNIFFIRQR
jgi:hypothetical protein